MQRVIANFAICAVSTSADLAGAPRWSAVDVLVVAERLPDSPLQRLEMLGPRPGGVQPVELTFSTR